jgi:hypothetical protein
MDNRKPNEESFLRDVAKHEVKVLLDNGIYRHLRLAQPQSSNMWFDVVTWPGHLAYAGDMGSFVFSRLPDMFEFFRTDSKKDGLGINLSYWGEKLEAVERDGTKGSYKEFSPEKMREHIEENVAEWIESEGLTADEATELREEIEEEIYRNLDDGPHEAYRAVRDFSFKQNHRTYEFHDAWEWGCEEYTCRFIWCCYGLAWAIKQYDTLKTTVSNSASQGQVLAH